MIFIGSLPLYFNSRPSARGDPVNVERKSFTPSHFNSRPSARGDYRRNFRCDAPPLFQFTPLREGRPYARTYNLMCLFQFTPLREGRPDKKLWYTCRRYFNSRPSARGDPQEFSMRRAALISIHAPPRGATSQKNAKKGFTRFQFTPLREGRRAPVWYHIIRSNISIHAPPRGATCAILVSSAGSISIHAPPRGATRACWLAADGADISIHAPPRGATEQNRRESGRRSYFNSRPSARGDAFSRRGATYSQFQFTPLREGRRKRTC